MRAFAHLLDRLLLTPSRNGKLALLRSHFENTPDPDRGYALAAIAGTLAFPGAKPAMLRALIGTRMDPLLFEISYDYVGDLAETIALAWPARAGANREPSISEVIETLAAANRAEAPRLVEHWLDALDATGRWALLKLITGALRIGAGARLAKQAAADFGAVPVGEVEQLWHGLAPPYASLFAWLEGRGPKPEGRLLAPFRPVMLAQPLEERDLTGLDPTHYAAEWKWDGIRVQAVRDRGVQRLYTRSGEDVSEAFPDVLAHLPFEGVLDGELLVRRPDGTMGSFNDLQQRLNRKKITAALLTGLPAFIQVYDVLTDGEEDTRILPFAARRRRLEALLERTPSPTLALSPLVPASDWEALASARAAPPHPAIEGLMLKRWDSTYEAGRPRGPWFKWKRDPFLIDAVLLYAQRGHGKRGSLYSDFTFGLWRGGALTPIGKAYFGFTDQELKQLDAFVRAHTIERFGPVRAVRADADFGLVLEVAFDGVQRSNRHKSGVALRFPRIHRIRWDKPASEADQLATLERLIG